MNDDEILAKLRELQKALDYQQRTRCAGPNRDKWTAVAGLLAYAVARAEQPE